MPKLRKDTKTKKKQKQEKYNAENEIIIGVTTVNKEKRVDNKRSTRANHVNKKNNRTSQNRKRTKERLKENKKVNSKNNSRGREFTKEEKIKKNNKKRIIISVIISFIVLIAALIFMMTTPRFYISDIEVEGNNKNSSETYISLSKIELNNTNIFAISKNAIIKNIKENPYVDSVEIKRKLPTTIHIKITEREVAYQIKYNDNYIYLDKQGYALEINEERKDTTKILGLNSSNENINEGQRVKDEDLTKLDIILKIINYCKYNSIENTITSIDISDKSNIKLNIDNGEKTVYLGDASSLSERMLWLKTILEKEKNNKGEIFINGNMNDSKVYFKPAAKN